METFHIETYGTMVAAQAEWYGRCFVTIVAIIADPPWRRRMPEASSWSEPRRLTRVLPGREKVENVNLPIKKLKWFNAP